ncbi:MAG: phenylalanine--tRNA ligase subunit beta [Bdellovibrionales bacterium]|nr:phenylalanine--tRNA ligase subunit beta [Bdellovibrionales bacterium]
MLYSFNWLNEFISLSDLQPQDLAQLLNERGLEVEALSSEKLDHVVIGQITKIYPHPNADKLQICHVKKDKDQAPLSIVCGAKNPKTGDKVVLCLEGAVLPGNFKIQERKIRGELSQGILASKKELGISSEDDGGIFILPTSAPIGSRLDEYLKTNDTILDVFIPPNRVDLMSHIGLARELSSLLDKPFRFPFEPYHHKSNTSNLGIPKGQMKYSKSPKLPFVPYKNSFNVKVYETDICPYYSGQMMKDVQIGPSPYWLKKRLELLGVNSVNNIVDITTWILLEWGQPLHAFDLDTLEGGIHVKKAKSKDQMLALNEDQLTFRGDELVIRDDKKNLALAGVIGGKSSAISDKTKNIFIESAVFAPYDVRRTARRLGLNTASSFQFSRGVFPHTSMLALQRACSLIQQVAGGSLQGSPYEEGSFSFAQKSITINQEQLNERLGYEVPLNEFTDWMKKMNSKVTKRFSNIKVTPPYYRKDVNIKEDLIEEWARLKGYDFVPKELPVFAPQKSLNNKELNFLERIKHTVKEQGYYQAINYSFVDHTLHSEFLGEKPVADIPLGPPIFLTNPITQDLNSLRQSLLPGLFQNLLFNMRHGEDFGRLFEQGISFFKTGNRFEEKQYLSFMVWGQKKDIWNSNPRPTLFDLKSSIDNLLTLIQAPDWTWTDFEGSFPFLHTKRRLLLKIQGQTVGFIGAINPMLSDQNKIRGDISMGELNLSLLLNIPKTEFKFQKPSLLPSVKRDISLLIPNEQNVEEILNFMKSHAPAEFRQISLVDYYEGVQKGFRSVSFRFIIQGSDKTLSEKQISSLQQPMVKALLKKYPVQIR